MDLKYSNLNLDGITEQELIEQIQKDFNVYQQMKTKISSLKKADKKFSVEKPNEKTDTSIIDETISNIELDENFESEVDYYRYMIKNINVENLETSIISALPSKDNYQYEKILMRIQAEIMSEVKLMRELINDDKNSDEDKIPFLNDIDIELEKIRIIKDLLKEEVKEHQDEQIEKNNIVFIPTINGNIRIIEDINNISKEFYPKFKIAIKSIEEGIFKNPKRFYMEGLNGLSEVRYYNTRVLYCQLNENTYGIVGAFVKKTTYDAYYHSMLHNYDDLYKLSKDTITSKLSDPNFMELQEEYYKELFNLLEPQSDKIKVKNI